MKKTLLFTIISLFTLQIQAQRNVILIIADDLGTDYFGFYEDAKDTVDVPNIRALVKRGVRFKNAMSNPVCSAMRAGMLTGRYSFRTGVGGIVGGAGGSDPLPMTETTLPQLLKIYDPNIAKANIGKWHLHSAMPVGNLKNPNTLGYDHYEGNFIGQLTSFTNWTKNTNGTNSTITNYATTETTNNAISWIKNQGNKPFFLWLAYNAPHAPYHVPPTNLHKYGNATGVQTQFKAMLQALDTEMGRLFTELKTMNKLDSTDIIFIGDNGNTTQTAQIANTAKAKGTIYQYGVHVPFIVAGPSVVQPNRASDALVNTLDIFATTLELMGYANWKSQIKATQPVDSKSFLPIIKNTATKTRDWTFTEIFKLMHDDNEGKAMRNVEFKLLQFDNGKQEFYNLKSDPEELTDLLLKTSLTATELSNYQSLCSEMNKLLSKTDICKLKVGTQDEALENITIFPNPFENFIKIENAQGDETYELSNNLGQIFYKGKNIENQDFSALTHGIYFLKINEKRVLKMVKE
jgi:arylsulfatase B